MNVTPPLATTLTANWTYISAGQTVIFTNTTTGGTGSNIFSYTLSNWTGVTQSGNKFTFANSGKYGVTLHVTDKTGELNQSSTVIINVTPALTITSFIENRSLISVGQGVIFSNTTTGGTGSNVWTYQIAGGTYTVGSGGLINFTQVGNYSISLGVRDKTGEIYNSTTLHVNVTQPLTIKLKANWTYISAGQSVTFSNTTTGGTGSNIYSYTLNCEDAALGNKITFPIADVCTVTEHVWDASGETNQSSVTIQVTPPLNITSFTENRTLISVGQGVVFSNTTTGGTQNDTWTYQITGGTYTIGSGGLINFTSTGNYTISLGVKDTTGEIYNSTTLYVNVTPPLTVTLLANRTHISLDQPITFTNTTTGGTGSLTYFFTVDGITQGPKLLVRLSRNTERDTSCQGRIGRDKPVYSVHKRDACTDYADRE